MSSVRARYSLPFPRRPGGRHRQRQGIPRLNHEGLRASRSSMRRLKTLSRFAALALEFEPGCFNTLGLALDSSPVALILWGSHWIRARLLYYLQGSLFHSVAASQA